MSILRKLRGHPERSIPWSSFGAYAPFFQSGETIAGIETALTHAAVWACIDVITDAVSRTPVDVVRYVNGTRQPVDPLPRLIAAPNPTMGTPDVWRTQLGFSLATHGNAFGKVIAQDARGYPLEVQLVDPYMTTPDVKNGRKWIGINGEYDTTWEHGGSWWHCPGRTIRAGSPYGLAPLDYAAKTIGLGLAAEQFSNAFFTDGGHPTWGFFSDTDIAPDQAAAYKAAIVAAMKPGTRDPLIMGTGLKPERFSVPPGETQFIDLMRFVCEQAARVWRVPPTSIAAAMSGQSITYSTVSDEDLRKLKDTFVGYFVRIENTLTTCLPRPQVVKFNQDAILRGDPKLRTEVITAQITAGLLSVNEGRRLLDYEPWPETEYDQPFAHTPDPVAQDPQGNNVAPNQ